MIELLKPIADKILVMIAGNHPRRTYKQTGTDPERDIAAILGVPYEPDAAMIKIRLGLDKKNKPIPYIIYATCGSGGGGRKVSAGLNNAEDMLYALEGTDIICIGHVHRLVSGKLLLFA